MTMPTWWPPSHRTPATDGRGSRATTCPARPRWFVTPRRGTAPRSIGTAGAGRVSRVVSGSGCWFRSGKGLVPVSGVFVHDLTGTHRDEFFFSTDQAMSPEAVIAAYTGRWNIEPPLKNCVRSSAWRRRGGGVAIRCCGPNRACSGCIRSWSCCTRDAGAVAAGAGGGLAGEARRRILGRDHGGTALAVAGMGFRDPRPSRSLAETRGWMASDPVQCPGSGGMRSAVGRCQQPEMR